MSKRLDDTQYAIYTYQVTKIVTNSVSWDDKFAAGRWANAIMHEALTRAVIDDGGLTPVYTGNAIARLRLFGPSECGCAWWARECAQQLDRAAPCLASELWLKEIQ